VELVISKYVGTLWNSTELSLFHGHSHQKASKAHNVANMIFTLKNYIGVLPPKEGKLLYMAQIDPYFVYGCEVALNISLQH
jgi:hypothetical protein